MAARQSTVAAALEACTTSTEVVLRGEHHTTLAPTPAHTQPKRKAQVVGLGNRVCWAESSTLGGQGTGSKFHGQTAELGVWAQHTTTQQNNKQTPQHKQHARLVVGQRLPWVRRLQATPPSGLCASLVCSTNTTTCTHPHKTDNNTNTHHKAGNLNKRQASKLRQALQANTTLTALKYDGQHQHHHHVCAPQAKASNKAWQQQTGSRSSNVDGQVLGELVAELTALTTLSVGCEPHQQAQQTLAMDTLWCAGVLATDASQVQPLVAALQHNTNLQRLRLWRWCTTLLTHHTRHTLHTQSTAWWCVCRACAGQQ